MGLDGVKIEVSLNIVGGNGVFQIYAILSLTTWWVVGTFNTMELAEQHLEYLVKQDIANG